MSTRPPIGTEQFLYFTQNERCWECAVRSKKGQSELAIKIMRHRELSHRTTDENLLGTIKDKVAELEQKLREIVE